jgi:hypothetical protein
MIVAEAGSPTFLSIFALRELRAVTLNGTSEAEVEANRSSIYFSPAEAPSLPSMRIPMFVSGYYGIRRLPVDQ